MRNIWIAVIIALVVGGFLGLYIGYVRHPSSDSSSVSVSSSSPVSAELSANMRKLWEDHITWTRMYLIDVAANDGFANADAQRLMKNQEDIGNAIKPYYGDKAGSTLTTLLKQHILGAVALVNAEKAQDVTAESKANTDWYDNANQIADFLAKANPNWSDSDVRSMMKEHLDLTKQEALDILDNKDDASIADYEVVHKEILQMADALSIGIRQQFPQKF